MTSVNPQAAGSYRRPIVISGPSGVGKGTLIQSLIDLHPCKFLAAVSHTTREPRPGETKGIAYYFVTSSEFSDLIARDGFVEHTFFSGSLYGTSKEAIALQRDHGPIFLLGIDIEGVKAIKESQSLDARYVFIKPPSFETLRTRLLARGTEEEANIQKRLARARTELEYADTSGVYDMVIINDDLDEA